MTKKPKKNKITPTKHFDYLIIFIFIISIIAPIQIASNQSYLVLYGDDIEFVYWAQTHHTNPLNVFEKLGTGYRPIMLTWLWLGYNIWGSEIFYYYILNGALFSGAMVFLYLLGKTLHSRIAGLSAVLMYLFLDGTFMMVSKFNFIAFSGEIFFITSALYFSIQYFKTDNKIFMWIAIILSGLGFLSKEPSLLIIPIVNLAYLWYSGQLKKNHLLICSVPFIYMFLIMFVISPEVGTGDNVNLSQRIISNLGFYIEDEYKYQFRTPALLLISFLIAGFYFYLNKFRREITICVIWIMAAFAPFLITGQKVQHTYLIEANLGMVLLIGMIISEGLRKNNIVMALVLTGIIFQAQYIQPQITNTQKYHQIISDNQITFFETVESLKQLPSNETIFYFPEEIRKKYGMQINEDFFKKYLCIRSLCDIKVTTNYSNSSYVILPSSLDVFIFQKEKSNERVIIINNITHGKDVGFLLKK